VPRRLGRILICIAVLAFAGCARRTSKISSSMMPHPGGCYVLVYDETRLTGAREFINGPEKYYTLRNLPYGANWRKRIRSAQVGPGAAITVWADEGFQGASMRFHADRKYPTLTPAFDREIESLSVACTATAE
jgi:hypothetical protein